MTAALYYPSGNRVIKRPEPGPKGTTMGYVVCTVENAENAPVVADILNAHTEMRRAIGSLRKFADKAMRLNDADNVKGNVVKAHKIIMAMAGALPGYEAEIDHALKQGEK